MAAARTQVEEREGERRIRGGIKLELSLLSGLMAPMLPCLASDPITCPFHVQSSKSFLRGILEKISINLKSDEFVRGSSISICDQRVRRIIRWEKARF